MGGNPPRPGLTRTTGLRAAITQDPDSKADIREAGLAEGPYPLGHWQSGPPRGPANSGKNFLNMSGLGMGLEGGGS